MTIKKILLTASLVALPAVLGGQGRGIAPEELLKPLGEQWTTHNGDYSGRRYSSLKQIDQTTVKNLSLAWVTQLSFPAGKSR